MWRVLRFEILGFYFIFIEVGNDWGKRELFWLISLLNVIFKIVKMFEYISALYINIDDI